MKVPMRLFVLALVLVLTLGLSVPALAMDKIELESAANDAAAYIYNVVSNPQVDSTEAADPDITGMALQALAKYKSDANVQVAVEKSLHYLSKMQDSSGGYYSVGRDAA